MDVPAHMILLSDALHLLHAYLRGENHNGAIPYIDYTTPPIGGSFQEFEAAVTALHALKHDGLQDNDMVHMAEERLRTRAKERIATYIQDQDWNKARTYLYAIDLELGDYNEYDFYPELSDELRHCRLSALLRRYAEIAQLLSKPHVRLATSLLLNTARTCPLNTLARWTTSEDTRVLWTTWEQTIMPHVSPSAPPLFAFYTQMLYKAFMGEPLEY